MNVVVGNLIGLIVKDFILGVINAVRGERGDYNNKMEKRHKKINCKKCRKNSPHAHKGCNEHTTMRTEINWTD